VFSNHRFDQPNCRWFVLFPAIMLIALSAVAQTPRLVVRVGDVLAPSSSEGIPIPVFMENYADTVAAFQFWALLSNPDVFEFQNTPLKASEVYLDTGGTLISGWQLVEARSLVGTGMDAKVTAQANTYIPPYVNGIGYPQYGEIPLIKILADTYELSENPITVTAEIRINTDMQEIFGFIDQLGQPIGTISDTTVNTTCWNCVQWMDPPDDTICAVWEEIQGTTGDSCVVDTFLTQRLDTSAVHIYDGSLTLFLCGDVNGDYKVNIFDITDMIGILYISVPAPDHWQTIADVNKDETVNIFDIAALISYLYIDGPPPECNYEWN